MTQTMLRDSACRSGCDGADAEVTCRLVPHMSSLSGTEKRLVNIYIKKMKLADKDPSAGSAPQSSEDVTASELATDMADLGVAH